MCRECGAIFGGGVGYAGLMLAISCFKVFGQSYICLGIFTPLRCYCGLIDYPLIDIIESISTMKNGCLQKKLLLNIMIFGLMADIFTKKKDF